MSTLWEGKVAGGVSVHPNTDGDNAHWLGLMAAILGYGLFLSWMWIIYFGDFAVSYASMDAPHSSLLRVFMLVALFLALPIMGRLEKFFVTRRGVLTSAICSIVCCPCAVLVSWIMPCSCQGPCDFPCFCPSMLMQAVAWVLSGVGYALFLTYWVWFLVFMHKARGHAAILSLCMVVSAAVFFLINVLISEVALCLHVLLPLISVLCSTYAHKKLSREDEEIRIKRWSSFFEPSEQPAPVITSKSIVIMVFSGVAVGFCCQSLSKAACDGFSEIVLSLMLLVIGLIMFVAVRRKGRFPHEILAWFYVPAAVICLIPMAISGYWVQVIFACVLVTFFTAASFAELDMLIGNLSGLMEHITRASCHGRMGNVGGLILGWCIGMFATGFCDGKYYAHACLGLVVLLVVFSTYVFKDVKADVPMAVRVKGSDGYDESCQELAERFGLTPRQTDVLKLLGKGRTAQTIQDRLCISESTVRTHTYNIYQKLGIHTQQELIDILEEEQLGEKAS